MAAASNSYFCFPPLGKVDTRVVYDPTSDLPRSRKPQSPQKENTCDYYAIQILRNGERAEKNPTTRQPELRRLEAAFSFQRKSRTKLQEELRSQLAFAKSLAKGFGRPCTREVAQVVSLEPHGVIVSPFPEERRRDLSAFSMQKVFDDFPVFLKDQYYHKSFRTYVELFVKLKLPFTHELSEMYRGTGSTWETLTIHEKEWHAHTFAFSQQCQLFNLVESCWNPELPVESLIEQLHLHGPHLVVGKIGRPFYEIPPFELKVKVAGRAVFGWKPEPLRKEENTGAGHFVVIVGAKLEEGKGYVYFVDPNDGSDPRDPSVQKVYVISYQRLKSTIALLNGLMLLGEKGHDSLSHEAYAMYNSQWRP
jgi:hypothetical protein